CAGVVAVGGFAALVMTSGTDSVWLNHGGFAAVACLWVALIVAALLPGPVRALLSTRPLPAIGRISYGLYLFHWPIFLALSEERTGLDGVRLLVVRLATTGAVAAASYRWIERPIRYPAP